MTRSRTSDWVWAAVLAAGGLWVGTGWGWAGSSGGGGEAADPDVVTLVSLGVAVTVFRCRSRFSKRVSVK